MVTIQKNMLPSSFDIEGHRGCRGLLPENSLPAFEKALELGVTTLEMDLVISKDNKVVVSHEPYFNHEIALTPEGKEISEQLEKNYNLYRLSYREIRKYDCGSKVHPRFPSQAKMKTYKPLFEEVVDMAEAYCKNWVEKIYYNVEIKSTPEGDSVFHPPVETFSDLVCNLIEAKGIRERTLIQSFDLRSLQYIRKRYPGFQLSLLIENELTPQFNINILGFVPEVYSPDFHLVNEALIAYARSVKMKVIPWTVNDPAEIQRLSDLGVDGVITDYPDLFQ